ncbi:metallophosphoesterase-domain-containing protein [Pseudoroseomonas deserti]|uniref:Metallophosphoesterase-domain-containing protein n=1 Tax=Teichococcus deserti TaxID=1817963 RepID=A0A1V2GYV7_9PROT|nr:metallophosphoesterase [Pseudoroseomonas deserti]ONG50096.1 metallophosphoesterase-domain-containing protein [Pseudoroseomonas deserti]
MTRIAIVTDIHHGLDNLAKKGSASLALMAEFARFVADSKPDLVLDLGDRITDSDHDTDLVLEREVAEAFAAIEAPILHINGNHDRDFLSVAENEAILGQPLGHRVIDAGDWRVVLWRADTKLHRPGGFRLAEPDLIWLEQVVRQADRPLLIASHVPLSGHDMTGNYWFERNQHVSRYPGSDRIRAVLARATVPVACVAGHVHWNSLTMLDAIPHFTLQSLVEISTTAPQPAGAWGLMQLDRKIDWEVFGLDPFAVRLDAARTVQRPLPCLPVFRDLALPVPLTVGG